MLRPGPEVADSRHLEVCAFGQSGRFLDQDPEGWRDAVAAVVAVDRISADVAEIPRSASAGGEFNCLQQAGRISRVLRLGLSKVDFARLVDEDVCRAIIGPVQSAICAPNAIARQDRIRRRSILRAGTHAARRATERFVHRLFQKTDLTAAVMFRGNLNGAGQTGPETVALCHGFGPGVLAPWRGA
jgi:hypothetical protein